MCLFGLSDILTRTMARLGIRKESNNAELLLKLFRTLEASRDQMELRCNFFFFIKWSWRVQGRSLSLWRRPLRWLTTNPYYTPKGHTFTPVMVTPYSTKGSLKPPNVSSYGCSPISTKDSFFYHICSPKIISCFSLNHHCVKGLCYISPCPTVKCPAKVKSIKVVRKRPVG